MSLAKTLTRAQVGIDSPAVSVEVHLGGGLPATAIVGLAETSVKESKDRVKGALINSEFQFPRHRIIVNLAPADLPKEGGRYDLAIAIAILAASGQIPIERLHNHEFLGELSLSGELRPVRGILPSVIAAKQQENCLIIPESNQNEASIVTTSNVLVAKSLLEVCRYLCGAEELQPPEKITITDQYHSAKLSDIRGQYQAKRALLIAAAGGHNILFTGPPGTGKTMLANRLTNLLPTLTDQEALEIASIQSVAGLTINSTGWLARPFRAPHHTASAVAIVGGGSTPRPGEISLAHLGVLFLDELAEFDRRVLEVLREPLESGEVMISRARQQVRFPAKFQLIAAMNPCPCGYYGESQNRCSCSLDKIARYRSRVSGPLLDRIDLHVDVPALPKGLLSDPDIAVQDSLEHERALHMVNQSRAVMYQRNGKLNHDLSAVELAQSCKLSATDRALLDDALEKLGISARGYFKILRIARTIADIADREQLVTADITEALSYRNIEQLEFSI